MTRSALPLIFGLLVLFASCKKNIDNDFDCEIQGIANLDAKVGDTKVLNLMVSKIQGASEDVTLSLKNVPAGITYSFETEKGNPNFATSLSISISNVVKMGSHIITLEAKSENLQKTIDFNLTIDDNVTMTMKVYDGSKWSPDLPAGELAIGATINLYKDSLSFASQIPYYSTVTDSNGIANFYHLQASPYFFVVEKDGLSNIALKKFISNKMLGFATSNIDNYGQLQFRDQNGDGKITDADRTPYDKLIVYDNVLSQRIVWIGQ